MTIACVTILRPSCGQFPGLVCGDARRGGEDDNPLTQRFVADQIIILTTATVPLFYRLHNRIYIDQRRFWSAAILL